MKEGSLLYAYHERKYIVPYLGFALNFFEVRSMLKKDPARLYSAYFAPQAGLDTKSSSGNGLAGRGATRVLYQTKGEGLLCSNYLPARSWEVPR